MDPKINGLIEMVKESTILLAKKTEKIADVAGKKASEAIENTKLSLQVYEISAEIENLQKEIGKLVYDVHAGIEIDEDELQKKLVTVDEKKALIEEVQAKIDESKPQVVKCDTCDKEYTKDDVFCSKCGKQL